MGRGRRGFRSGGGGLRHSSSGGKSSPGGAIASMSPIQQQAHLTENHPGRPAPVYVVNHPKSGFRASGSHEFPYEYCQNQINFYCDAVRVCGSDWISTRATRSFLNHICGLDVKPEELEKGNITDVATAAAARL